MPCFGPIIIRLLVGDPSDLFTSSFAPFGRSGRMTYAPHGWAFITGGGKNESNEPTDGQGDSRICDCIEPTFALLTVLRGCPDAQGAVWPSRSWCSWRLRLPRWTAEFYSLCSKDFPDLIPVRHPLQCHSIYRENLIAWLKCISTSLFGLSQIKTTNTQSKKTEENNANMSNFL